MTMEERVNRDDALLMCKHIGCSGLSRKCIIAPEQCNIIKKTVRLLPYIKESLNEGDKDESILCTS